MLATEQLNEPGPDYSDESQLHTDMIKQYTNQLEQRNFVAILRLLYPTYNPKKALASALLDLEKAAQDKKKIEEKKAIWQATSFT